MKIFTRERKTVLEGNIMKKSEYQQTQNCLFSLLDRIIYLYTRDTSGYESGVWNQKPLI